MVLHVINKFRRWLANVIHKQEKWEHEERLSINGVFDYALNNKSKRQIIRDLSTSSAGYVSYQNPPYSTISIYKIGKLCHTNDVYISNYVDESKLVKDEDTIAYEERHDVSIQNNQVYEDAKL